MKNPSIKLRSSTKQQKINVNEEAQKQSVPPSPPNKNENQSEQHKKCVPLEIYEKIFKDKVNLQTQLNKSNLTLKEKENEILNLQNTIKQLEKEKSNLKKDIATQETFINTLKEKIEKLEILVYKHKENLMNKENELMVQKEKFDEFRDNLEDFKKLTKFESKQELIKKEEKINLLKNEIEIQNNKNKFLENRINTIQEKYLRLMSNKKNFECEKLYTVNIKAPDKKKEFIINKQIKRLARFKNSLSQGNLNIYDIEKDINKIDASKYANIKEKIEFDLNQLNDNSKNTRLPNIISEKSKKYNTINNENKRVIKKKSSVKFIKQGNKNELFQLNFNN